MAQHSKYPLKCLPSFIFLPKICPQNNSNKSRLFHKKEMQDSHEGQSIFLPLVFWKNYLQLFVNLNKMVRQHGQIEKLTSSSTNLLYKH